MWDKIWMLVLAPSVRAPEEFRMLRFASLLTACLVFSVPAMAAGPGGGITTISPAQARAAGAGSISAEQCLSICRSSSRDQSQCPTNCRVSQCYSNSNSGRSYCVRAQ
jgi:hypothetical protein